MINENIAKLTGLLNFQIDISGLRRFDSLLNQTEQRMKRMSAQADAFASKKLKLSVDTSALDEAKAKLDRALNRELRGGIALANQKRQSFAFELSQQRLVYAGTKEQQRLVSNLVRSQQEGAVIAAKAYNSQSKVSGVTKQQLISQDALTASLTKQARLEAIVAKTRAAARRADDHHLLSMTKTQRVQEQINRAIAQSHRANIKHIAQAESMKRTDARKSANQEQRDNRYRWAEQRQQHWQANKDSPRNSGMLGGGVGGVLALGGIGAAIAGLTRAVGMIQERVQARQDGASEAEQYGNLFAQMGKGNQLNVDKLRKGYEKISIDNGSVVSLDDAKMFRTYAISEMQRGKNADQVLKQYEVQQQAYRIAGLTPEEIKRSNIQQQQIRGKGYGDTEDLNTLTEANPLLRPYILKAWGEANKFKSMDDPQKLEAAFMKALPKRGLTREVLDRSQQMLVADNQPALLKQQQSIQANQARNDTQAYLSATNLNSQAELVAAVNDNIKAHKELAEALQPVKAAMRDLDTALTKLVAGSLRELLGKNADGSDKTPEQKAAALATVGGADGIITLPNQGATSITEQQRLDANAADPVSRLWNWIAGGKDAKESAEENRARWADVKVPEKDLFGLASVSLKLDNLIRSLDAGDVTDGNYRRFRPDAFETFDAASAMKRAAAQSEVSYPTSLQTSSEVVKEVTTNNITAPVTFNITAKTDASPEDIAKGAKKVFDDQFAKTLSAANAQNGSEHQ